MLIGGVVQVKLSQVQLNNAMQYDTPTLEQHLYGSLLAQDEPCLTHVDVSLVVHLNPQ